MLKFGCTLPNLANICLHSSTNAIFYPFTETHYDLLSKVGEDVIGGPSIVPTRKVFVEKTHSRKSTDGCKTIVGINARRLSASSVCQPVPTGLDTRYEFNADLHRLKERPDKCRSFEKLVMSCSQRMRPDCRIESFHTTRIQRKIDCFNGDGLYSHCNTEFEGMGCFHHYCLSQEARRALTQKDIQSGIKKEKMDEKWKQFIEQIGNIVVEMW